MKARTTIMLLFPSLMLLFSSCAKNICSFSDHHFIVNENLGNAINDIILENDAIKFSGAVLVADSGKIVLEKSYHYSRKNDPCDINPNSSYWIASVSKQFCAASILHLYDDGKLDLADPISKFFQDIPQNKAMLTIHQLLTHTSGLGDFYAADGIEDRDKAVLALLKDDLVVQPGSVYSYSNQGYQLLAIIVEVVSGISYEQFLQENFFTPLGLENTGHSGDQGTGGKLAISKKGKGASKKTRGNPQYWPGNYGYKGSTGVLTRPRDLFKWHEALQNGLVLSDNSTQLMFSPHTLKKDNIYYGYGWNIIDSKFGKVIVHSGDDDFIAHYATIRYYPDQDRLLILFSNSGYRKRKTVATGIVSSIINRIF